mmetsp:Transcript_122625/g.392513  ORF Transcript_122625/g.392513 Transcript_122625/m.392513 type:complete len:368 (-) Transcript_122625:27-1130(-)
MNRQGKLFSTSELPGLRPETRLKVLLCHGHLTTALAMPAASSISISSEDSKQAPWCGHLASVTWTRFCSGPGAPTLNQKMTSCPVGSFSLRPGGLTLAISRSTRLCCSLLPPPAASKRCWYSCIQACPSTKSEALRIGVRNHNTSSPSTRSGASSGALRRGRRLDACTDGDGAAELAKAEEARRATSEAQARIAAQAREREAPQRLAPGTAGASVWNANAWHWEERPMNDWAHTWLKKELGALRLILLGGAAEATLSDIEVSGDASVSVRKGKHVVLFSLSVTCKWSATSNSAGIGDAKGSLQIPEFTSEDGAKSAVIAEPGLRAARGSTQAVVKSFHQEGVRDVRGTLSRFVTALKEKLPSEVAGR